MRAAATECIHEPVRARWAVERDALLDCVRRLQLEAEELRDLLARQAPNLARLKLERDAALRSVAG